MMLKLGPILQNNWTVRITHAGFIILQHMNTTPTHTYALSVKTSHAGVYRAWKNVCIHLLKNNALHFFTSTLKWYFSDVGFSAGW